MKAIKVLSVETLKNRIVKAIKAGNHETRYIIESCDAELSYYNFCEAIADLQSAGTVVLKPGLGYYIA